MNIERLVNLIRTIAKSNVYLAIGGRFSYLVKHFDNCTGYIVRRIVFDDRIVFTL